MRMTEGMRREEERKYRERVEAVDRANDSLNDDTLVSVAMNGSHVMFVANNVLDDDGNSVVIHHLTDAQVDSEQLADSRYLLKMALGMHRALRVCQPIIEAQAVAGFKQQLKDLLK